MDGVSHNDIVSGAPPPVFNTTEGIRQFELQSSDARLPDSSSANGLDPNYGWIGPQYTDKHELDANGTTIPERHGDALCSGATFFVVLAYLVPTSDNFH